MAAQALQYRQSVVQRVQMAEQIVMALKYWAAHIAGTGIREHQLFAVEPAQPPYCRIESRLAPLEE